jgi:hypothetical protein
MTGAGVHVVGDRGESGAGDRQPDRGGLGVLAGALIAATVLAVVH